MKAFRKSDPSDELVVGESYYVTAEGLKKLEVGEIVIKPTKTVPNIYSTLEELEKDKVLSETSQVMVLEVPNESYDEASDTFKATTMKVVEEVSKKTLQKVVKRAATDKLDIKMRLTLVKQLQQSTPQLLIGGSIALYLHGVNLKRFIVGVGDLDLILPYWQDLNANIGYTAEDHEDEDFDEDRPSGSDYDETTSVGGVKADIRIDPKHKFETIEYKGFKYKVVPLWTIIEAKAKYAASKWGEKHRDDLREMILNEK